MNDATHDISGRLADVLAELDALRSEVARLRGHRDSTDGASADVCDEPPRPQVGALPAVAGRRNFLRVAAGVAAGAAGAAMLVPAKPAAAATGTMMYGALQNAGIATTSLLGTNSNGERTLSVANFGSGGFAYGGEADYVYGGYGNVAAIYATGGQYGGHLVGNRYGLKAVGQISQLHLEPNNGSPADSGTSHLSGEIYAEFIYGVHAGMWVCVESGTPGTWRVVANPASAGALHAVTPHRVYDSRWNDGPLLGGRHRQLSVKDGRALTGAVDRPDLVARGATAIAYNLTVTATSGSGFLAITPADATTYAASAINWSTSGVTVANASMVTLDAAREVRVWAGGGGTDFIIDVVGYYR